jgi:Kef-type K+ transport system membrane component KefB
VPALDLLLLQLLAILAAARLCGSALGRLGQPRAVGEIVAGLALGPSVFGALAPRLQGALFPAPALPALRTLSDLGVLLFLLAVGMRLDLDALRARARTAVVTSHASIIAPFALGLVLAGALPRTLAGPNGAPLPFALFVATALSVTAFPVLATIVTERGLMGTRLGTIAIAAAAVDDVTAWCLLAGVVAAARAGGGLAALGLTLALSGAVIVAALAARPLLARLGERWARVAAQRGTDVGRMALPGAVLLALALALATQRAGVHALFGAFLAGTLVPRAHGIAAGVAERLEGPVAVLLLPTFFAYTGLRTEVGLLGTPALWGAAAAVLVGGGRRKARRLGASGAAGPASRGATRSPSAPS